MRAHLVAPLAAILLALSACGDGGGIIGRDDDDDPPTCTSTTCGTVVIGLTDADGDFLSYAVDVVSLKLERSNGATVETLPIRQRVDFAELVDLTELLTAKTVPNGTYVKATLRLDYSDADVSVESGGVPVEAIVVDDNGDTLETVDLELELDNANRIVVAPGTPALLQLDFDLAASHDVDITATPVTAVGEPFLFATTEPVDQLKFRVRGPLVSVDEAAGSYVIDLRPFNHPDAELGRFTVETTVDTAFEVDGEVLDGPAALAAMEEAGAGTLTAAQGVLDVATLEFTAEQVLAGDSVPGADFDVVIGNVVARDGNELSVRGATIIRRDDEVVFLRGPVTITIGSNTVVTQEGGGVDTLNTDAISVGQRIHAFGEASGSDPGLDLDATDGRVRLHVTNVIGTVRSAVPTLLTLELFSIDGRDPAFFIFDGTGGSILTDADPQNYEVDTLDLDVSEFDVDEPAQALGFVTPFGEAPPDFAGRTLVNFDNIRALLGIGWGVDGTDSPFLSMGANGFVIDINNPDVGARHFIKVGPRIEDFTDFASPMTIEPVTSGRRLYALSVGRRLEMYRDFAEYADRVNVLLNAGNNMRTLTARGSFDEGSTTLTANVVAISFTEP
jgi:hypothetical protein